MDMQGLIARFSQWTFPRAFRIESAFSGTADESLAQVIRNLSKPVSPPPPGGGGIPERFALDLCNYAFRIERNEQQMQAEGQNSKEQRSIQGALKKIKALLQSMEIEYTDPTGQAFTEGRDDFDLLGQAEERPGLKYKTIISCECPVVKIKGKMKQKARGVVARPQ
jgi:hypothetical protein